MCQSKGQNAKKEKMRRDGNRDVVKDCIKTKLVGRVERFLLICCQCGLMNQFNNVWTTSTTRLLSHFLTFFKSYKQL